MSNMSYMFWVKGAELDTDRTADQLGAAQRIGLGGQEDGGATEGGTDGVYDPRQDQARGHSSQECI